ncbi:MAG: hypothetical protein FJ381_14405 [Verrucomicrobia bacterium]|nr:hypothetical protein [Verrucomicrobiota bacterium]
MTNEPLPPRVVAGIAFLARGGGAVKALRGFRKGHHAVPEAVTPATSAFLARLCAEELAAEAEALFQQARTALDYKRKDLSLQVTAPTAVLTARDFTLELTYALDEGEPARYVTRTSLQGLRPGEVIRGEAFNGLFAGRFTEIAFALRKGVVVEAVIDAVEGLGEESALRVDYPSDCRECVLTVPEVAAAVRCTGVALEVVFPRGASPAELMAAFAAVRDAFGISRVLSGLIR